MDFTVSENMLPEIISGQVREIQTLEASIKIAVEKAEAARSLALSAKEKSAGLFQKKEAAGNFFEPELFSPAL